jgi:hypothetical protein
MAMPAALTRKIAGVPTWGWLAAAVFAIGIGLYIRRRSVASTSTSSSTGDPTDINSIADALAGGAPKGAASGLDPALADLLSSAIGARAQAVSDATMGAGGGYYDPGTFYGDFGGGGFDEPASVNVASSGAGTVYDPTAGMLPMIGGWYSPGFDTLTRSDLIAAGVTIPTIGPGGYVQSGGAAPLAHPHPVATRPASRPTPRPATRSSGRAAPRPKPSKKKAAAKGVGGWVRVR